MDSLSRWRRFKESLCDCPGLGVSVDYSRMLFPPEFFETMGPKIERAFHEMKALEAGAIANPDENRMVGHYWLRSPERAPTAELRRTIEKALRDVKKFARDVHAGRVRPPRSKRFENVLIIGIGGSALGPQFVSRALRTAKDKMRAFFFDNTDPDGIDAVLGQLAQAGGLARTLAVAISKSGATKETRNGMLEAEAAWTRAKLSFPRHAVAVTGDGSELDRHSTVQGWLARFPMWDWVGGRTSELAAVGLLPAALQGVDVDGMLLGARYMDEATRVADARRNPAAVLALMWHHAGGGRGLKDMVVLPYKDRLELFSRYLQQLVMESLGKERDLAGNRVEQGIAVYGNKGSTDQHAYVQQLRDGVNNFFVTFLEVLRDRQGRSLAVEPGVTAGDYLSGFLQGTRRALADKGRESITVTVDHLDAMTIGKLIALYERAVGFYASLAGINAYHQPGVEAGKKAAGVVIELQKKVVAHLRTHRGAAFTSEELAEAIGESAETETVHWVLRHLAANPDHRVKKRPGKSPFSTTYSVA
ncbi:MAG: glucose-6-phosphate isomerase [Candidatus Wallbacteria bacterium]|nr:glucose-6-phosphate isomerase [Candidatus Wallbacteria bacterium]